MSLMQLPPTLPSWARSKASIFFPTQNFRIRKGRRSGCEILLYPLALGDKLLFFSQLKSLRSERDIVAVREFPSSSRSKPITVFTCRKSPYTDDRLPIGYSPPDFQLIWNNFKIEILQLQIALKPYEFDAHKMLV